MRLPLSDPMSLCLDLMNADSEDEVVLLLQDAGYWEDSPCWRLYGDNENNFSTIGDQQGSPDAALVEKLVNSVDARLMNECQTAGIDPTSPAAPQSVREAVARFFERARNPASEHAGRIQNWPVSMRTEVARGITVAATGSRRTPSFTVADCGEGQSIHSMPSTILSLHKSVKLRIPFVQGKFHMGGTGVLRFCGQRNLQFVLSRRNPALVDPGDGMASRWTFTIVRREDPVGDRRSSVYTYLAPITSGGQVGGLLSFATDEMPIFPQGQNPYSRTSRWGTLIKLYEYDATGFRTNMMLRDGFLGRADLLLPDVALPIRFHECRDFGGHAGSFETTLTGLGVRLADDSAENVEPGFPAGFTLSVMGEPMTGRIYAFRKDKAKSYRKDEGIIFVINGQTHGYLSTDFFRRRSLRLDYIRDSILVIVDCSHLRGRAREDLFMNSRDRLSGGDLRKSTERELEDILAHHAGLLELAERRRREEREARLAQSKPLAESLESILRQSPTLSALFLAGRRVSNPLKRRTVAATDGEYAGERFPTYFRFRGRDYGEQLMRDCHINRRCRIAFETDATNDYLDRDQDRGEAALERDGACPVKPALELWNGIGTLSIELPSECRPGDELAYSLTVNDPSRTAPFVNHFRLRVLGPAPSGQGSGRRRKPPGGENGQDRELPSGLALPEVIPVTEEEWNEKSPPFDQYTALRVMKSPGQVGGGADDRATATWDFHVNVDNTYLKSEQKRRGQDPKVTHERFITSLVLLGLGMLHDDLRRAGTGSPEEPEQLEESSIAVEDKIEEFTRAVGPVLIPMVETLGALEDGDW